MSALRKLAILLAVVVVFLAAGLTFIRSFQVVCGPASRQHVHVNDHAFWLQRTDEGIMQAWAEDDLDIARAQGYAHAMDRGTQLYFVRIIGQGRLSELLADNEETNQVDTFIRQAGFHREAKQVVKNLDQFTLEYLQAYAEGVNAFNGSAPLELAIAGVAPEPWTPVDSVVLLKLLSFLGLAETQQNAEKWFIQQLKHGNEDTVEVLRQVFSPMLNGITPELVELIRETNVDRTYIPKELFKLVPRARASNNWAVSGAKTKSGAALSASDPHLEVNRLPGFWYEMVCYGRKSASEFQAGITLPGIPGVMMGRSNKLTWSFTYGFSDMLDYYIEDCEEESCRGFDGKMKPLTKIVERILRKSGEPLDVYIYETQHGLLELSDPRREGIPQKGKYLSRATSTKYGGASIIGALRAVPNVSSVEEACKLVAPSEVATNFIFTDLAGRVAYQQGGTLPKRKNPFIYGVQNTDDVNTGLLPLPGWLESSAWEGKYPPSEHKTVVDPEDNMYATANNNQNVVGKPMLFSLHMGSYRSDRIYDQLKDSNELTLDDFKKLQLDLYSRQAEAFMNVLRPMITVDHGEAGRILSSWDLHYDVNSLGATVFEIFYQELLNDMFEPMLGGARLTFKSSDLMIAFFHYFDRFLLESAESEFWRGQTRAQFFARVLGQVSAMLDSRPELLITWGERQQFVFNNVLFQGKFPFGFLDYGPVPMAGNRATVKQGQFFETMDGRVGTFAPSWRMVSDQSEYRMWTSLPGGPSGCPFSGIYDSQVQEWLNGEYHLIELSHKSFLIAEDH